MFTGIIENSGKIKKFIDGSMEVETYLDLSDCNIGSSICCDGVCLTATEINVNNKIYTFKVNIGEETKSRTNYKDNKINLSRVINLEKSLRIGDEIAGHFVYGHVDCTTNIYKINKLNNSWEFYFNNFQNKNSRFLVEKASVAINGISLTVAKSNIEFFTVSVIPHTFENTNLKYLNENNIVNIEFDYLARFSDRNILK